MTIKYNGKYYKTYTDSAGKDVDVEQIKKEGAVRALKERIITLKSSITDGPLWDNFQESIHFCKLSETIDRNREILDEMEALLIALQELEPINK
ncbi:MAG: hypothetical protein PHD05_00435 [Sphaerochaetaceae bacterium]|nr:hypothetical protein [Sphaerochaetaceae bacterium]